MKEGDFVEIEYVGKVKLTGEIFDLTSEELAKKEKIYNPKAHYGPALVIIGSEMVIKGVMKELEKMEVGEERTFDVSPEEGFGLRNPKLIKILPISKFFENNLNPIAGEYVEIDGLTAKVQSVSGGRVRLDFNHPLAGKVLTYTVKILRKIEDEKEKIEALLKYYRVDFSEVKIEQKNVEILLKKKISAITKKIISDLITKWIKGIEKIDFKEPEKTREKKDENATEDEKNGDVKKV
ncbi:MAG: peptidylprolyl isomerase [Candidatus Aenigmatarchaeota archaeon]